MGRVNCRTHGSWGGGAGARVTGVDPASTGLVMLLQPPAELAYRWGWLQPSVYPNDGWDFP
ncbi:UNVERIFIED_CONTAM: hypothetical protein Slati_0828500 [Sesamum latifolium]|uniref:Uncharacterized protein n=1 Tax=Sesamum latifolium TaxID=2727402 RepID=A0AAW2XM37_9LAMI